MALEYKDVVELYVTMFQRAPEQEGVTYWLNVANSNNLSRAQLATEMAKVAVSLVSGNASYQNVYPQYAGINLASLTQTQAKAIIESMYKILFNKAYIDDPTGIDYWTNLIANKKADFGTVVDGMLQAAKTYLNSTDPAAKAAAQAFVNKVNAATQISTIVKSFDGTAATFTKLQTYIQAVTDDPTTVNNAVMNAAVENPQFTANADTVNGSIYYDTFYSPAGTLQTGDTVNGGVGNDTLIIGGNPLGAAPTLNNVENINMMAGGSLDLLSASGVQNLYIQPTSATQISNIPSASIKVTVDGQNGNALSNVTLNYKQGALSGASDILNLTVENGYVGNIFVTPATSSEFLEKINITSTGNAANSVVLSAVVDNVVVSGDKDFALTFNSGKGLGTSTTGKDASVDASGLNANFTATIAKVNTINNLTVTGSTTGKDDISFAPSTSISGNATITTGGGDDIINVSNLTVTSGKTLTIDAGTGNDNITLDNSAADIVVLNKSNSGYDTINLPSGATTFYGKFKVSGLIGFVADNTDVATASISGDTNTSAVLQAAGNGVSPSNTLGNDDNILVLKDSSSNSYIYYYKDANNNGLIDSGDTLQLLAKVVGVDLTTVSPSNLFTT